MGKDLEEKRYERRECEHLLCAALHLSMYSCLLVNIEPCSSLPLSLFLSLSLFHFHPLSLQPAASLSSKRGHCLSYVPRGMLGELAWPGPQLKSTLFLLASVRKGMGTTTPAFLQLPASSGPLHPLALFITIQIMSEIDASLKQSWLAQTIRLI